MPRLRSSINLLVRLFDAQFEMLKSLRCEFGGDEIHKFLLKPGSGLEDPTGRLFESASFDSLGDKSNPFLLLACHS